MNLFGPELMGSIALALDPAKRFREGGQLVDVARRRRVRDKKSYESGYSGNRTIRYYRNYIEIDDIGISIVPEFLFEEVYEDITETLHPNISTSTTFFEDSTDSLRAPGCKYNEMEASKASDITHNTPPGEPITCYRTSVHHRTVLHPLAVDRTEVVTTFAFRNGPIVPIVGNFGNDSGLEQLHDQVKQFATDNLDDYLPKCLSNRRMFDAAYQLGELRELPKLFLQFDRFYKYLRTLAKDPKTALVTIDKLSGDTYLAYLFGQQSIQKSIESLMKLPESYSKKVNFLLRKDKKRVSQRFTKVYKKPSQMGQLMPSYTYIIPHFCEYEPFDEKIEFNPILELRCVVNSTISFPELAVPKFSQSRYRELIGLNPTIADLYNLLPWTWLSDWYTGLGKYISLLETIARDKDIINYGFVTVLLDHSYNQVGNIRIYRVVTSVSSDTEGEISHERSEPVDIPYRTGGRLKYRTRFSVDDLFGVKSVLDKQGLLTETQKKILWALLTKFL